MSGFRSLATSAAKSFGHDITGMALSYAYVEGASIAGASLYDEYLALGDALAIICINKDLVLLS